MVKRLGVLGLACVSALLCGCPNDLGRNLKGSAGLRAPASLQGSPDETGQEILLWWEDQATNETGYRLEISPGPFGTSGSAGLTYQILPAGSTQYLYASVPNHSYYFRLFAVTDTMESDASNELLIVTPIILPGQPEIVAVTADWSIVILQWTRVSHATGYVIEVTEDGGAWTSLSPIYPPEIDRAGFVPTPGVKVYQVRIYATGTWGNGLPSDFWTVPIAPREP